MESKAEDYRRRANEAGQQAEVAHDPAAKTAWLNIAKHWRDMADQAERNGW